MNIVLHIGLHKTGSSTLQKKVFPNISGITYLGRYKTPPARNSHVTGNNTHIVYSDETLLGRLIDLYKRPKAENRTWVDINIENLIKIAKHFPNARIIIGLRYFETWILSIYKHYLRYGGNISFSNFYGNGRNGLIRNEDLQIMPRLLSANKIFQGRFYAYFLEDLASKPQETIENLLSFLGCTGQERLSIHATNKGVSKAESLLIRYLNKIPWYGGIDHLKRNDKIANIIKRYRLTPYLLTTRYLKYISPSHPLLLTDKNRATLRSELQEDYILARRFVELNNIKLQNQIVNAHD